MIQYCEISSPLGMMLAAAEHEALTGLWFYGQKYYPAGTDITDKDSKARIFISLQSQLNEYFEGKRRSFDLPLEPAGSPFRQQVWALLQKIPFGETSSYGQLACHLAGELDGRLALDGGKVPAAQAVGGAVGHNPISILIPCHRVLAKDGKLTGYAGGLDKKAALLQLEGVSTFRA